MKITAIRVVNYKGFLDSGDIPLSGGWNVVVGQNNAGKTALMEGFRLGRNEHRPHKNITFPRGYAFPTQSIFHVKMAIRRDWLKTAWLKMGGNFDLPISAINLEGHQEAIDPAAFWDGADLHAEFEFEYQNVIRSEWPSHRLFAAQVNPQFVQFVPTPDRKLGQINGPAGGGPDSLPSIIRQTHPAHVYTFDAKRFAVGECSHEDTNILQPDASNLPAVLLKIMGNPDLFREFNNNVSTIFPSIKGITVTTKGANFEVRIWPVALDTRRDDLSVPLNECGTGVGQVLAILYVAMTNEAGVIAVDEPNSFLHPGAAKKLIQLLKRYDQHQYVISTHSPEVMAAAQPAKLHLVRFDGQQSRVESFDDAEVETKRMMLQEVGASISDVFSAEKVVWVEGPTERECFDLIAQQMPDNPTVGLAFVALRNTGDFEAKTASSNAVLDVYDTLSRGGSILPVAVAFCFDREQKSERQIEDLQRRCDGRAHVLPRRMTENYLLNPAAIASVLTMLGEQAVLPAQVEASLKRHAPRRMPKGSFDEWGSVGCFEIVDAANLLGDVFHDVTEGRQEYRKVRDAVEILRVILQRDPEAADELVRFVRGVILTCDAETR